MGGCSKLCLQGEVSLTERCLEAKAMLLEASSGYFDKKLLFALGNVVVQRRLPDTELVRDVLHRHRPVAAFVEQGLGGVEQTLAGVADGGVFGHGAKVFCFGFVYLLIGR